MSCCSGAQTATSGTAALLTAARLLCSFGWGSRRPLATCFASLRVRQARCMQSTQESERVPLPQQRQQRRHVRTKQESAEPSDVIAPHARLLPPPPLDGCAVRMSWAGMRCRSRAGRGTLSEASTPGAETRGPIGARVHTLLPGCGRRSVRRRSHTAVGPTTTSRGVGHRQQRVTGRGAAQQRGATQGTSPKTTLCVCPCVCGVSGAGSESRLARWRERRTGAQANRQRRGQRRQRDGGWDTARAVIACVCVCALHRRPPLQRNQHRGRASEGRSGVLRHAYIDAQ